MGVVVVEEEGWVEGGFGGEGGWDARGGGLGGVVSRGGRGGTEEGGEGKERWKREERRTLSAWKLR